LKKCFAFQKGVSVMTTSYYAERANLYRLQQMHPQWSRQQLAATLGRSREWVKKWRKRFREEVAAELPLSQVLQGHGRARIHRPPTTPAPWWSASSAAQMPLDAAELAYRFINASYRSIDRREPDEYGGLPGVTREYRRTVTAGKWGEIDYINTGIEGYGWGALRIHLLMCYLLGLSGEEAGAIKVAPVLPQALRRVGASYKIESLPWGKHVLSVQCIVKDAQGYTMRIGCSLQQWEWKGEWGEERKVILP
jgi:Homeodomain-like domain